MLSHEWPLPPPRSLKPSSSRRKLTSEALAAVDWNTPHRFASYSDGEDESPSPHARADPLELACQSSGYGDHKSSACRDIGGSHRFCNNNNCNCLQAGAYGVRMHTCVTKITPSNKEAKVKLPVNRRVDHTSLAPQQNSAPLRLSTCPFSGPLKLVARTHPNRSIMPEHVTDKKKSTFDPREPSSPQVTCLGRVRIKEHHGNNIEISIAENGNEKHAPESKKELVNRNHKADGTTQFVDRNHASDETKATSKSSSRNEAGDQKRGCLARRRRRVAASAVAIVSDTTETRRERAAALARSLTSLLEDLRKLEMEKEEYRPAVPPPNSLLLMRGLRGMDKSCVQEIPATLNEGDAPADTINDGSNCENRFGKDLCLSGMKMKMDTSRVPEQVAIVNVHTEHALAPQVLTLSEIQSNSLVQNTSLPELKSELPVDHCKDRHQELALWQRRAIAKLDSINTKVRAKHMEVQRPATD